MILYSSFHSWILSPKVTEFSRTVTDYLEFIRDTVNSLTLRHHTYTQASWQAIYSRECPDVTAQFDAEIFNVQSGAEGSRIDHAISRNQRVLS